MAEQTRSQGSLFFRSVGEVFSFFLFLGKRAKKTKVFFFLSLLPVILVVVIKANQFLSSNASVSETSVFSNILMVFDLQFLILVLALFYGTSVCSEELEGKTLPYLATRPIPKSAIIVGKYAAYTLLTVIMIAVSLISSFLILNSNRLLTASLYPQLLRYLGVLVLGLVCYTAFFTLLGTVLKKAILVGLVFGFGWESVIQYFPGSTQKFSIVHYLKSMLPTYPGGGFSFLLFRLEPTPAWEALLTLALLTAVFLVLACLAFTYKEYLFED